MSNNTTKFKVKVTDEDIKDGDREWSQTCMVAKAIKREIAGACMVLVDIQTIRFSVPGDGTRYVFLTPSSIQDYIVAFDAGDEVQPFEFVLSNLAYKMDVRQHKNSLRAPVTTVIEGEHAANGWRPTLEIPSSRDSLPSPGKASYKRSYGVRKMRVNHG